MGYQKNTWTVYDELIPDIQQPNSFITKAKLDHIEQGIENAVTDLQMGEVSSGYEAKCELVQDANDPTIKRLNMIIPKQISWTFSTKELHDKGTSPIGTMPNDIVLDVKGNIFSVVKNDLGEYRLEYKMNIKGSTGLQGPAGPQGLTGENGKDGTNGKDGNKWVYAYKNVVEGEEAPETAITGDYVLDNEGDIFLVKDDLTVTKLLNIKGADGKDAINDFNLTIGEVTIGDTASAEITSDHKLNLTIPKGDTGASGIPGTNGKDGAKGEKGDQGSPGINGKDGVGISNITSSLESDGKTIVFTFTLDNGKTKTTAVTLP